jgi:arabinofuranosyltransferase
MLKPDTLEQGLQVELKALSAWIAERPRFCGALLVFVVLYGLLINAWVTEDAYITLRSVEQVYAGNGPRWNPQERVQAYSHPPWFWLLVAVHPVLRHPFAAAIALGLTFSLLAIGMLYADIKRRRGPPLAAVAVLTFVSSKAAMDFTTSGLENSLSYFLVVAVLILARRYLEPSPAAAAGTGTFVLVVLCASLLAANRLDSIALTLPLCGLLAAAHVERRGLPATGALLLAGATPILASVGFSLFYYGLPLPNPVYAKMLDGAGLLGRLVRGVVYTGMTAVFDPLLAAIIIWGASTALLASSAYWRAVGAGIALQVLTLVAFGGDFMVGRLLTPAFIAALFAAMHRAGEREASRLIFGLALFLLFPFHPLHPFADHYYSKWVLGIGDERAYYSDSSSLEACVASVLVEDECPAHRWLSNGRRFQRSARRVTVQKNVGYFGYAAGVDHIVVDELALTDAFLARMPLRAGAERRVGHGIRVIPEGYLESLEVGENRIRDPSWREYYERVRVLTQAPLLSPGRLRTILLFNLGRYNSLLGAPRPSLPNAGR